MGTRGVFYIVRQGYHWTSTPQLPPKTRAAIKRAADPFINGGRSGCLSLPRLKGKTRPMKPAVLTPILYLACAVSLGAANRDDVKRIVARYGAVYPAAKDLALYELD